MRELFGSKNTIGQMASVLKKFQKAIFTFTFHDMRRLIIIIIIIIIIIGGWLHPLDGMSTYGVTGY